MPSEPIAYASEPIAYAFESDNNSTTEISVDEFHCGNRIACDVGPFGEASVRCRERSSFFRNFFYSGITGWFP